MREKKASAIKDPGQERHSLDNACSCGAFRDSWSGRLYNCSAPSTHRVRLSLVVLGNNLDQPHEPGDLRPGSRPQAPEEAIDWWERLLFLVG